MCLRLIYAQIRANFICQQNFGSGLDNPLNPKLPVYHSIRIPSKSLPGMGSSHSLSCISKSAATFVAFACCMLLLPRSPQIRPTVCKLRTLRRFRQVIPCGICRIRFAEACAISRLMPVFTLLINAPVRLKLLRLLLVFLFVRNQGLRMFRHRWEERKRRATGL